MTMRNKCFNYESTIYCVSVYGEVGGGIKLQIDLFMSESPFQLESQKLRRCAQMVSCTNANRIFFLHSILLANKVLL